MFRVPWVDDQGEVQVNRGMRVEFNSAIGPYKGGLRFHPSVNLGIIKFLGFEQIFKNALTTLPMGGGKGGSDFDPKGKSDMEVMRFCQSFMTELFRHIGPNTDVPAGDIGVGGREIGFLFGQYKRSARVRRRADRQGPRTGAARSSGPRRPATAGLLRRGNARHPQRVLRGQDGSSSPARATSPSTPAEKVLELGGKVITLLRLQPASSSRGRHRPRQARLRHESQERPPRPHQGVHREVHQATYTGDRSRLDHNPLWDVKCDVALPCATQNEINGEDARTSSRTAATASPRARTCRPRRKRQRVPRVEDPLRPRQGRQRRRCGRLRSRDEPELHAPGLDARRSRQEAARHHDRIHENCVDHSRRTYGTPGNYVNGANIAGFLKVADAMMDQGVV
jgi:glutamate dehydrogenase (NADP+)